MDIEIINIQNENIRKVAPLVANFRVALKSYKGIQARPNVEAGVDELLEYLEAGFPIYAATVKGHFVGYMVCRVDEPCVWVESIYVDEAYRHHHIASKLLAHAETLAHSYGEDTLYFYVHPNNHRMISFLRKHGYTVLNLIEIRKPYPGEKLTQEIQVGDHLFDY